MYWVCLEGLGKFLKPVSGWMTSNHLAVFGEMFCPLICLKLIFSILHVYEFLPDLTKLSKVHL
jgi:hypothetical protein